MADIRRIYACSIDGHTVDMRLTYVIFMTSCPFHLEQIHDFSKLLYYSFQMKWTASQNRGQSNRRISAVCPPYIRHECHEIETSKWRMSALCPPIEQAYIRRISAVCLPYVRHIFAIYVTKARHQNGVCLPYVRRSNMRMSASCPPHLRRISADH